MSLLIIVLVLIGGICESLIGIEYERNIPLAILQLVLLLAGIEKRPVKRPEVRDRTLKK
ncbi:MAG: hypothetical protein AAFY54_01900 [Cyanobacteria bacterium J06648_10]